MEVDEYSKWGQVLSQLACGDSELNFLPLHDGILHGSLLQCSSWRCKRAHSRPLRYTPVRDAVSGQ